jgi:hypothetical protein
MTAIAAAATLAAEAQEAIKNDLLRIAERIGRGEQ